MFRPAFASPKPPLLALRVALGLVLAAVAISPATAGDPESAPVDVSSRVLGLLHDARFDDADAAVDRGLRRTPDSPELRFLSGFVTYWRLLYDPDHEGLRDRLDDRLERVLDVADPDRGGAFWSGSAHLLRAQLRGMQGKRLGAAMEAKRARRDLLLATESHRSPDSDFGLGTYLYYADRLPTILKGLRVLLFLPGGDRDEGLRRLERAAEESEFFGLEARVMLASIHSDRRERSYDVARTHAEAALREYPDRIVVLHGAAALELSLGRPDRALELVDRALARAARIGRCDPAVLANLRYYAARAEADRFRPDLALERIAPLWRAPETIPSDIAGGVREHVRVWTTLSPTRPDELAAPPRADDEDTQELRRRRRARVALRSAEAALELERAGRPAESTEALLELSRASGTEPVVDLLVGRAVLFDPTRADAVATARRHLDRAARSKDLTRELRAEAWFLAGVAADLAGDRSDAVSRYRRAEVGRRFGARDAARMFQGRPARRDDLPSWTVVASVPSGGGDRDERGVPGAIAAD